MMPTEGFANVSQIKRRKRGEKTTTASRCQAADFKRDYLLGGREGKSSKFRAGVSALLG